MEFAIFLFFFQFEKKFIFSWSLYSFFNRFFVIKMPVYRQRKRWKACDEWSKGCAKEKNCTQVKLYDGVKSHILYLQVVLYIFFLFFWYGLGPWWNGWNPLSFLGGYITFFDTRESEWVSEWVSLWLFRVESSIIEFIILACSLKKWFRS